MDIKRKRLLYRSNYRGFKEADLMLGGFAKAHMDELSDDEVLQLEALLEENDHNIYAWLTGKIDVPAQHDNALFQKIKSFSPV